MSRQLAVLFGAGAIFGAGLVISGMTDPKRVLDFLDVKGTWDPSLAMVMAGAVGTYALGMAVCRKAMGGVGWFGNELPSRDAKPVNRYVVGGSLVFGVAWGIGGFCPGPAVANLGALRMEALVFVPAMMVGMALAQRWFGVDGD